MRGGGDLGRARRRWPRASVRRRLRASTQQRGRVAVGECAASGERGCRLEQGKWRCLPRVGARGCTSGVHRRGARGVSSWWRTTSSSHGNGEAPLCSPPVRRPVFRWGDSQCNQSSQPNRIFPVQAKIANATKQVHLVLSYAGLG